MQNKQHIYIEKQTLLDTIKMLKNLSNHGYCSCFEGPKCPYIKADGMIETLKEVIKKAEKPPEYDFYSWQNKHSENE